MGVGMMLEISIGSAILFRVVADNVRTRGAAAGHDRMGSCREACHICRLIHLDVRAAEVMVLLLEID